MWVISHKVIHGQDKPLFTINCLGISAAVIEKESKSKNKTFDQQVPTYPHLLDF